MNANSTVATASHSSRSSSSSPPLATYCRFKEGRVYMEGASSLLLLRGENLELPPAPHVSLPLWLMWQELPLLFQVLLVNWKEPAHHKKEAPNYSDNRTPLRSAAFSKEPDRWHVILSRCAQKQYNTALQVRTQDTILKAWKDNTSEKTLKTFLLYQLVTHHRLLLSRNSWW